MRYFIFMFVYLVAFSCEPPSSFLFIANNSDSAVYVQVSCSDTLNLRPEIRRVVRENDSTSFGGDDCYIPSHRQNKLALHGRWEDQAKACPGGTLKLFFINETMLNTDGWDTLAANQKYSRKIELSSGDIMRMGRIVEFK